VPNRREPLNFADATGGLNLRSGQLQLAPNESPEMCNIALDPLGGVYTRPGWSRWNAGNIVAPDTAWDPRRGYLTQLSDGTDVVYLAANDTVFHATGSHTFVDSAMACSAVTHLCDFASLGDTTYFARGRTHQGAHREGTGAFAPLTSGGSGSWNDDYINPVGGVMPQAELCEGHAGYLFTAHIVEDGTDLPNRLRWSHPTSPEDWAELDFLDIGDGGSHITGLMSFEDHLLIFKPDSMWALYGYDTDSWQLVKKSSTIGARGPHGITRSETAVFFHSASDRGGIYAYGGERPVEISTQLRRAFEDLIQLDLVWVGWMARKLWVTMAWNYAGPSEENASTFVYDPSVGEGAWTYYTSNVGPLGPIVAGSNIDSQFRPLGVLRSSEHPFVMALDLLEAAWDATGTLSMIGASTPGSLVAIPILTNTGAAIEASGSPGLIPFETYYRTPWFDNGWPTRKKSWRRPDLVCRRVGAPYKLQVRSFRDYNDANARRQSTLAVDGSGSTRWGEFTWGHATWNASASGGSEIERGSSFGLARALQIRFAGLTPGIPWGIDAVVFKLTMRRFI